ncbi:hypothetical protein AMJ83_00165 [candidate division WOR_3 bacterium SM23_42]|uniref:Glycosyl transferase family 28 C-terminal domain-containing protein n=1 Tax=candidate division WOR_3 bacterium SM23_42 TaxID=1703779 RepID=A0A0S8FVF1_UNCW3|nr:MAG: hypothetical protein AMJ83_00165 [candidate division WOR_3 bacterium SM23_42]
MSSKTIWIVYSSRKGGHLFPSLALYERIAGRRGYGVQIINTLDISRFLSILDGISRIADLKLKKIYRWSYRNLEAGNQTTQGLYRLFEAILYRYGKVGEKLAWRFGRPDIILSIQPEINVVAELFKNWFRVPFHTVIIDLSIHGLWINRRIDHYYVPNESLKTDLRKYGVSEARITATGVPLRAGFSQAVKKRVRTTRRALGLSVDLCTVLLVGGLLGKMFDFKGVIESILDTHLPIQILAVFGKNDPAMAGVSELKNRCKYPMYIYGAVVEMHELIWASDVVISKPGAITMTEVMSLGKPMIVINPLGGSAQELRAARFLQESGAGLWIRNARELGATIKGLFKNKSKYEYMCRNAKALGQHNLRADRAIFKNIKRVLDGCEN